MTGTLKVENNTSESRFDLTEGEGSVTEGVIVKYEPTPGTTKHVVKTTKGLYAKT